MANKILNELGEYVFAEGAEFSIARMRVKYPKTLTEMIDGLINKRFRHIDLIITMDNNKVCLDDYKILITTAINDSKYEKV